MINVKKVYFTSVAIVLFIIIAGCVSTQPHVTPVPTAPQTTPTPAPQEKLPSKTIHPISVVASVQVTSPCSGNFCNPAGPSSRITMNVNASSTDVPVTQLSATVFFVPPYAPTSPVISVGFSFDISGRNPLMPNQTASATRGPFLGPVDLLNVNGTAAVLIEGTLQNGQSFSYWTNETTS